MTSVPTTLVLLLALAVAAFAVGVEKELTFENRLEHLNWVDYKTKFGKSYENKAAELDRMLTFLRNKDFIRKHNEEYAQGKATHWLSLNKFADMKPSEFKMLRGFNPMLAANSLKSAVKFSEIRSLSNDSVPAEIDWRESGYVSEVKDQGQCGSCWAFSATGSLEGQVMRKTGKLVSLSEQNLMDCSSTPKYGNQGCNGGLMDAAFQYVIDNNGIDTEKTYPYIARKRRCQFKKENVGGDESNFVDVDASEDDLKAAVGTQGPVSVAIDAEDDLMWYGGGIYKSRYCSNRDYALNHGVLSVGYGTDANAGDFWIVKNSWGADWGEEGFVRMARNRNNMCGISNMASYPIV